MQTYKEVMKSNVFINSVQWYILMMHPNNRVFFQPILVGFVRRQLLKAEGSKYSNFIHYQNRF